MTSIFFLNRVLIEEKKIVNPENILHNCKLFVEQSITSIFLYKHKESNLEKMKRYPLMRFFLYFLINIYISSYYFQKIE